MMAIIHDLTRAHRSFLLQNTFLSTFSWYVRNWKYLNITLGLLSNKIQRIISLCYQMEPYGFGRNKYEKPMTMIFWGDTDIKKSYKFLFINFLIIERFCFKTILSLRWRYFLIHKKILFVIQEWDKTLHLNYHLE